MTGFRHIQRGILKRYGDEIQIKTFDSGERRVTKDPPKDLLQSAFAELGTYNAVATAFGVDRRVVSRWVSEYGISVASHPEAALATVMKKQMVKESARLRVAQWLMDEGSVSVAYFARGDYTALLVCGSMNDYAVLSMISSALNAPITSSKTPGATTLPMGAVRVQSARAFALLEVLRAHLVGLKAMEASAALEYFPSSGIVRGRHTTDEFLLPVWKRFALDALNQWYARRRNKTSQEEIRSRAEAWVAGRIRRARRFIRSGVRQATSLDSAAAPN